MHIAIGMISILDWIGMVSQASKARLLMGETSFDVAQDPTHAALNPPRP